MRSHTTTIVEMTEAFLSRKITRSSSRNGENIAKRIPNASLYIEDPQCLASMLSGEKIPPHIPTFELLQNTTTCQEQLPTVTNQHAHQRKMPRTYSGKSRAKNLPSTLNVKSILTTNRARSLNYESQVPNEVIRFLTPSTLHDPQDNT